MTVRLANSPDSWGVWFPSDPRQIPWDQFLDDVAAAGYDGTELGPYGYLPIDADRLRGELDRRGLHLVAGFVMRSLTVPEAYPSIEREFRVTAKLLAGCGATRIVLIDDGYRDLATGALTGPRDPGADGWKHLCEAANRLARLGRDEFGLQLVFHPHAETYVERVDHTLRFLDDTDPDVVSLCLDLGHIAYMGGDPIDIMEGHPDRVAHLHLKSVDASIQRRVMEADIPLVEAVKMGVFVEPESGTVDFVRFTKVVRSVGYDGWATVEQDMDPALGAGALAGAKRTRDYFRRIGLGE